MRTIIETEVCRSYRIGLGIIGLIKLCHNILTCLPKVANVIYYIPNLKRSAHNDIHINYIKHSIQDI